MQAIIYTLLLFVSCITSEVSTKQIAKKENKKDLGKKKKCNNLICLFDPYQNETVYGSSKAMAYDLMEALQEKVAPIIVTTNLINNFCYWKTHLFQLIDIFGLSSFARKVLFTNLDGWSCYFHKQAGLVLLVPQAYIESHASKQDHHKKESLIQCGFDTKNLDHIQNVSYSAILDYIEKHQPDYSKIIDAFESMFVKSTIHDPSVISTWNIYVSGHGSAPGKIKVKKGDEQDVISSIKRVQSNIQAIQRGEVHVYEEELIRDEKKLKSLLLQLKQIRSQGLSWKTKGFVTAGLLYEDFIQLMTFFEQGINTSYVHYSTCFAGGFNQTLLNQELASLDVNFIVSTEGINESVTTIVRGPRFAAFFTKLEILMCKSKTYFESMKDQELMDELIKDSIADIVRSIINRSYLDYTQPFVRIPSIGVFKALKMIDEVKLLTNSVVKTYEVEGSSIDYTDPRIVTIFVYPSYVGVPLKIKDHVAIVSPAPQTVKETQKPTIHILEKIFYQDHLFSIIPNFISFNIRNQRILFIIKELHCLDGEYLSLGLGENKQVIIKDMIIQIFPVEIPGSNYLDTSIDIAFTYNAHNYSISKKIETIQFHQKSLFNEFKTSTLEPIKDKSLMHLAEKIIGRSGIALLERKHKKITLSSMIEYFEEQIGNPSRAEKMKDDKYSIISKKMKKIERITSDVALRMQRILINKTESMPGLSWVHRIERLMSSVQDTLGYIDRLLVSDQDARVLLYKERLEKIMKTLTGEYEAALKRLLWEERSLMKIETISKKMQKIRDELMSRIEWLPRYIRGERQQKTGYGRLR